jgi:hypothetical protein
MDERLLRGGQSIRGGYELVKGAEISVVRARNKCCIGQKRVLGADIGWLKEHKNENFFGFDFEFCTISMLVMHK